MSIPDGTRQGLETGQVADFHFIHLDTVKPLPKEPLPSDAGKGDRMYKVAGKPRPMLVLSAVGDQYYRVLKLTTSDKPGFKRLGYLLDGKNATFTDGSVFFYPRKLVDGTRKKIDPLTLADIVKLVGFREIGCKP